MKRLFSVHLNIWLMVSLFSFLTDSSQAQNMEFDTDGFYNAAFFDLIYRGQFEHIELERKDMHFLRIFQLYLRTYGEHCADYLPNDKVKIMEDYCASEEIRTNGYGVEIGRHCVAWDQRWSGLYAKPDLHNAMLKVEAIHGIDHVRSMIEQYASPNAMGNAVDLVHKSKGLAMDMGRIFRRNECNSEVLKRFEQNLKAFALNTEPIRMEEKSKYATMKEVGGPSGPQDFKKFIDDLVYNQSKTWMMNRYESGSISGVTVSKDQHDKPVLLKANYLFSGISGKQKGWVKITFQDGLPECIYFWDYPNNCKTPSGGIVASYASGEYRK